MVRITPKNLFDHRPADARRMLRPLARREVACQWYSPPFEGGRVVAAHAGRMPPQSDFRGWRFPAANQQGLRCQYFELWRMVDSEGMAYLQKAYLHLFLFDGRAGTEEELIAVHVEPGAADSLPQCVRSFHLHVSAARPPLHRWHFPLTLSHLANHDEGAITTLDNITVIFSRAASALAEEVRTRWDG